MPADAAKLIGEQLMNVIQTSDTKRCGRSGPAASTCPPALTRSHR